MDEAHIACGVEQQELLDPVIDQLNVRGPIKFTAHYYPDNRVIQSVLYRDFGMAFPTSALALQELEEGWEELRGPLESSLFAKTVTCAVSPVVFFMSPRTAARLAVNDRPLGWRALLERITKDELRLRHASLRERDGIVVAIAEHLAFAAGKAPLEEVAAHLKSAEQAVEEYGPDDAEVLRRATAEAEWATDVVIAQERSILTMARHAPQTEGVIVYPHDGTLVIPTTVVSVLGWERPGHEQAFHLLSSSLADLKPDELARNGLHKDAGSLVEPKSVAEFTSAVRSQTHSSVQWAAHAGGTPLVLPGRRAVRSIRALAAAAKRAVDVCLLFDSSTSMNRPGKFAEAQAAIDAFLNLLQGAESRACVIRFRSKATMVTPLQKPSKPFYPPNSLDPDGDTALLDAVELALNTFDAAGDPKHMWAVVAFTDGLENSSQASLPALEQRLQQSARIRFYGVAYGADADMTPLAALANVSGGKAERGDQSTIRALYDRLATYV